MSCCSCGTVPACPQGQRRIVLSAGGSGNVLDVGADAQDVIGWLVTTSAPADSTFVVQLTWPGDAGVTKTIGSHTLGSPDLVARTVSILAPIVSIEAKSAAGGAVGVSYVAIQTRAGLPPGADAPIPGWGAATDASGPASWSAPAGARSVRLAPIANTSATVAVTAETAGSAVLWSYADDPSKLAMTPRGPGFRPIPEDAVIKANSGGDSVSYRPAYLFPMSVG